MSNAKEMPVPATTEQAAKEKGALTSIANYSTDSAVLQEGNSVIAIILPIPSVHERPKQPRKRDMISKVSNTLQQATELQNTGADMSAINAFVKGALKADTTKPRLKQAALEGVLDEMGISIRYNRVAQCVEFSGVERHFPALEEDYYFSALPVKFSDMLCDNYTHAEKGDVESYFDVISLEHSYNPILEHIRQEPWDGRDRFPELLGICMGVDERF